MSPAVDQALQAAYEDAARAAGDVLGARVFAASAPNIAIDAMLRAAERARAVLASLTLAMAEVQAEFEARIAAASGETHERRADA